ncbi:MAG TPA: Tim44/TimA family putative adaptor protein [Dongiaceae bacterium]|nr:Tim44/TimA family putative adaptor protein [Dongiaceae bacterium]
MDGGFQYLDLIFFGVVAVFLVMRLRSVLGRRTGTEQRRDPFAARTKEQPAPVRGPNGALPDLSAKPSIGAPAPATPLAQGLARIRSADPSFDEGRFTAGARTAFEMIVNAFAVGDTSTLRPLLSDEVFANFSRAIEERQKAGQTHTTTLVGMRSVDIIEADLQGRNAVITVKLVSDQINETRDSQGRTVDGDPTAVVAVTDIWTFSRNTRSRDPNWTLVATRSPS